MPLPTLSAAQIHDVVQKVAAYIEEQRQAYRPSAVSLSSSQQKAMHPFFPEPALDATRLFVLIGRRLTNPPFYGELNKMGFEAASLPDFSLMAAITFVDTVVSHEPFTDRLLFHELVHVAQYQKLGLQEFAAKYVRGFLSGGSYEAIPLEMNHTSWRLGLRQGRTRCFQLSLKSNRGLMPKGSSLLRACLHLYNILRYVIGRGHPPTLLTTWVSLRSQWCSLVNDCRVVEE